MDGRFAAVVFIVLLTGCLFVSVQVVPYESDARGESNRNEITLRFELSSSNDDDWDRAIADEVDRYRRKLVENNETSLNALKAEQASMWKIREDELSRVKRMRMETVYNWDKTVDAEADLVLNAKLGQLIQQPPFSKDPMFCEKGKTKCLPDVFFIGASKCGTTTMAKTLYQHPKVKFVQDGSEAHIFDYYDKGDFTIDNAKSQLRMKAKALVNSGVDPNFYRIIEYTPHYIYEPTVAYRLKRTVGDAMAAKLKFVVMLRNPVSRTFSSWLMKSTLSNDKRTFHQSVQEGIDHWELRRQCIEERVYKGVEDKQNILTDVCKTSMKWSEPMRAHVEKSLYAPQLEVWFSLFPRKNFFFVQLEDFAADPVFWYIKTLDFIGVTAIGDQGFTSEAHIQSMIDTVGEKNTAARSDKVINEYDRQVLEAFFRPYNKALDELLGWKTGYSV